MRIVFKYSHFRIIVLFTYNGAVTPDMKVNSLHIVLWYAVVVHQSYVEIITLVID